MLLDRDRQKENARVFLKESFVLGELYPGHNKREALRKSLNSIVVYDPECPENKETVLELLIRAYEAAAIMYGPHT